MNQNDAFKLIRQVRAGPIPLSPAQKRIWILQQFDRADTSWNRPFAMRLIGPLDVQKLSQSLNEIVRRHEILRTVFPEFEGEPIQHIGSKSWLPLVIKTLDHVPPAQRLSHILQLVAQESQTVFNLTTGPLVRAVVLRLNNANHILLLLMHHLLFDEWSERIFVHELKTLYESSQDKMYTSLPELAIQYADYSIWQNQSLAKGHYETAFRYWKKQLNALPVSTLATDYARSNIFMSQPASYTFVLPNPVLENFIRYCRRVRVTIFMALLTAFLLLIRCRTKMDDVSVGVPVACRTQLEVEPLIGMFSNLVVCRALLPENISFEHALERVCDVFMDAYEHQTLPFHLLVNELREQHDTTLSPLFRNMFELIPLERNSCDSVQEVQIDRLHLNTNAIGALDLTLEAREMLNGLSFKIRYAANRFRRDTVVRLSEQFLSILQRGVENPNCFMVKTDGSL